MVKLIGVNKGRHVTLKYFNILIKDRRKHKIFVILSYLRHKIIPLRVKQEESLLKSDTIHFHPPVY